MTDLYALLGVPCSASTATIREAYRRAAKRTHPDTGADGAEFVAVSRAWAILRDPEKRREYDETGLVDPVESLAHKEVAATLHAMLTGLISASITNRRVEELDLVAALQDEVERNQDEVDINLSRIRARISASERILARIVRREGEINVFADLFRTELDQLRHQLTRAVVGQRVLELCAEELEHYQDPEALLRAAQVWDQGAGAFPSAFGLNIMRT